MNAITSLQPFLLSLQFREVQNREASRDSVCLRIKNSTAGGTGPLNMWSIQDFSFWHESLHTNYIPGLNNTWVLLSCLYKCCTLKHTTFNGLVHLIGSIFKTNDSPMLRALNKGWVGWARNIN